MCFKTLNQSNPEPSPVRTWLCVFLYLESTTLTVPTEINLPYLYLPSVGVCT
jgi:hypothetical protein